MKWCSLRWLGLLFVGLIVMGRSLPVLAIHDNQNWEGSYRSWIASKLPEQELRADFGRLIEIYFLSQNYLNIFDNQLAMALSQAKSIHRDPRPDPLLHPNYFHLQASRILGDRLRSKLAYFYQHLQQESRLNDEIGLRTDQRLKLRQTFAALLSETKHQPAQLAIQDLLEEASIKAPGLRLAGPVQSHRFHRGIQLAVKNQALRLEVEALSAEIRAQEGFNLNSVFEPSPGRAGNVSGGNFPVGVWALTFDDGPSHRHTPQILSQLKQASVPATFFWLTQNLKANPKIVQSVIQAGYPIANHSYTHANIAKLNSAGMDKEISQSSDRMSEVLGGRQDLRFFRLPYGSGVNHAEVRERIARRNLIHVFWNVDSLDWQDKNPDTIVKRVLDQMKLRGQGIILFHDIHAQSVQASAQLLERLRADRTLRLVTIPEIVDELNAK